MTIAVTAPAYAGLSQEQVEDVGIDQKVGVVLPKTALTDLDGSSVTVPETAGGLPSLVAFVDYTCKTSCGVSVDALLARLSGLDMRLGHDFNVDVIGLDPKDRAARSGEVRERASPDTPRWQPIHFLIGNARRRSRICSTSPAIASPTTRRATSSRIRPA